MPKAIFTHHASNPIVTRLRSWRNHSSIDETLAFLEYSYEQWSSWPAGPYLVESRLDGQLLGGSGFDFENPGQAIPGYVLAQGAWGRGYATETLSAVDIARQLNIVQLHAHCHTQNLASARVLEKCGSPVKASFQSTPSFQT